MKEDTGNKSKAVVEVIDLGPLKITGKFTLKDTKRDIEESGDEVLLCLCGRSNNKPFCDGSHEK